MRWLVSRVRSRVARIGGRHDGHVALRVGFDASGEAALES